MSSDNSIKLNRANRKQKKAGWHSSEFLLITMENVLHLLDGFNSPIYAFSGIKLWLVVIAPPLDSWQWQKQQHCSGS